MIVRAVLLDLFGTVVHFAPQVPTVEVAGTRWRTAMGWLRETAERELASVPFDDLLTTLMSVTEEIIRQRPPEYIEVPSRERFRRALVRLGVGDGESVGMAERLSLAHMAHIASVTSLPAAHIEVLQQLAVRYRLALVSNFDHTPTARRILADCGIADLFHTIVISDEFGRRKPHAAIFAAALAGVGATVADAVFVGDSLTDDVAGAHNARLPVVWLNPKRAPLPADVPEPDYVIAQLGDLLALLE